MGNRMVGERLRFLRETKGVKQEAVAAMLGLKDRQSVSAIEAGERNLKADELVALVDGFDVPLDFFTNPFLLAEKVEFSWRRQTDADTVDVAGFEDQAKAWIGLYLGLAEPAGLLPATLPTIGIDARSSWEDAEEAGERIAKQYFNGHPPATSLVDTVTDKLGTLVLMVDASPDISGAACHLRGLNVALVNRKEVPSRRNFDLAHELFHIMTWKELPPDHIDGTSRGTKRTEELADKFAAALLMPRYLLEARGKPDGDIVDWINRTATEFGVSAVALKWRLKRLGLIDGTCADGIDDADLRHNGGLMPPDQAPLFLSRKFLEAVSDGFERGAISVRKVARTLSLTIDDLGELMDAHGVKRNFDF